MASHKALMKKIESKPRKRFGQFLRDALEKPGFNIPPSGPTTARFVVESSPKAAKCRICGGHVAAGADRVMIYFRHWRRRQKGTANWSGDRYHYHVGCIQQMLRGKSSGIGCFVCGSEHEDSWRMLRASSQAPYAKLCEGCAGRSEFGQCAGCRCYFAVHQLSRVLEDNMYLTLNYGFSKEESLCRDCEERHEVVTRRSGEKLRQFHIDFTRQVNEAVEALASWHERHE